MTNPQPAPAQATIRTMIVCIPEGVTPQMLTTGHHPAHPAFDDTTTFATRFWAMPKLRFWHRRQLINVRRGRKGTPTGCAGGRLSYLNLTFMRTPPASVPACGGGNGTRPSPAPVRRDPGTNSTPNTAPTRPRSAATTPAPGSSRSRASAPCAPTPPRTRQRSRSTPYEVEMYQAGQQAYQHYHVMYVICADAIMFLSGDRIQPASDSLADRLTYLHQVTHLLHNLAAIQRIAAISL